MGSVKPAVLPVPVWAPASRSPPLQDLGNGLRLDRRGGVVALFANGAQKRLGQAEVGELHVISVGP
jgi:hypothetical protein